MTTLEDAVAEHAAKVKAKRDARPWRRYKLRTLAANGQRTGRHEQRDRDGVIRSYPAGSVVESQEDLAERWPEKFEIIREQAPLRPEDVAVPDGYRLVKVQKPGSLHTRESLEPLDLESLSLIAADEGVAGETREELISALLGE